MIMKKNLPKVINLNKCKLSKVGLHPIFLQQQEQNLNSFPRAIIE